MSRRYQINEQRKEFYRQQYLAQEGRCMICGNPERLVVDHNHEDGYMRGLLCYKHNAGLGMFGDDVGLLRKAIEYLESTKTPYQYARPKATRSSAINEQAKLLLADPNFKSDRERARQLCKVVKISYTAAQGRMTRLRRLSES